MPRDGEDLGTRAFDQPNVEPGGTVALADPSTECATSSTSISAQ
jgi:hypothetical protein